MRAAGLLLLALAPLPLAAQSSQFGVRGFGLPGRELSARAMGTGGGFALFDAESSRNPASIAALSTFTASFAGLQNWRTSTNPAGEATVKTNRFPQILAGGRLGRSNVWLAGSISNYTDRDFLLATRDTIAPRGLPVEVFDTVGSTGGLNDLRLAAAWALTPLLTVGAAVHAVTGSNRLIVRRGFSDSLFLPVRQSAELEFGTFGVSAGIWARPRPGLALALAARFDGSTDVNLDSSEVALAHVDLPATVSGGALWMATSRLAVGGQATWRSWGRSAAGIESLGGTGAVNTLELAGGFELQRDASRVTRFPLRAGVHWTQLPFPLTPGGEPSEFGISVGTGTRFAAERGGVDFALERVWRSEGEDHSESAWLLTVGISVRP
ncbi:MAG TPA: hypothetical protein VJ773_11420 [Gemmatimonadales bacterium]|nr:hypothetical protein [Gemmatimonadales bacterium]